MTVSPVDNAPECFSWACERQACETNMVKPDTISWEGTSIKKN